MNTTSVTLSPPPVSYCTPNLGPLNLVIIVIYLTIFLLSLIGNSMVIFTILNTPALRTVTNMFLLNLAASDLLLSVVCLPTTLFSVIFQCFFLGSAMCHIISYLQPVSVTASAHTLVIIAVERFYAIVKPFTSLTFKTKTHSLVMVMGVWVVALLFNLPFAIFSHNKMINKNQYNCRISFPPSFHKVYLPSLTLEILVIPFLSMFVCYSFVIRTLWTDINVQKQSNRSNQRFSPAQSVDNMDPESICSPQYSDRAQLSKSGTTDTFAFSAPTKRRFAKVPLNSPKIPPYRHQNGNCGSKISLQSSFEFPSVTGNKYPRPIATIIANPRHFEGPNALLKQALLRPMGVARGVAATTSIAVARKKNGAATPTNGTNPVAVLEGAVAQLRSTAGRRHLIAKRRLIKMLIVLVVEFFICWAPFFIFNLMSSFGYIPWHQPWTYNLFSFILILAYCSSCTNPATYCFMNSRFRNAFMSHFKCFCLRGTGDKSKLRLQESAPRMFGTAGDRNTTIDLDSKPLKRKQGSCIRKL